MTELAIDFAIVVLSGAAAFWMVCQGISRMRTSPPTRRT